jgi:hypothetical protein
MTRAGAASNCAYSRVSSLAGMGRLLILHGLMSAGSQAALSLYVLAWQGRYDEPVTGMTRATELDPPSAAYADPVDRRPRLERSLDFYHAMCSPGAIGASAKVAAAFFFWRRRPI